MDLERLADDQPTERIVDVLERDGDVVRTLPRGSQALLGYAAHDALKGGGGYLGAVRVQDPVEQLVAGEL
jgi:hypothetical protein